MADGALSLILKHLREFVQSDWFLLVFISHEIDTARGSRRAWNVFTAHTPGWIDPLECRDLFLSWKQHAWSLFWREMTRAMPSSFHLNNGRARVYIRPYKPPRFKTIPLFSK